MILYGSIAVVATVVAAFALYLLAIVGAPRSVDL